MFTVVIVILDTIERLCLNSGANHATTNGNNEQTVAKETSKPAVEVIQRCRECRQLLDDADLKMFTGDPEDAVRNSAILLSRQWTSDV